MPDLFFVSAIVNILLGTFIFCIGLLLIHASLRKVNPEATFSIRTYCLIFMAAAIAYVLISHEVPYFFVVAAIVLPVIVLVVIWSIFAYKRLSRK